MAGQQVPEVPGNVVALIDVFKRKITENAVGDEVGAGGVTDAGFLDHRDPVDDPARYLINMAGATYLVVEAGQDLCKLIVTYAHGVSSPRPSMTRLAANLNVSLSAMTRRYRPETLRVVEGLIDGNVDVGALKREFRSLETWDLVGIDDSLDARLFEYESFIADCALVDDPDGVGYENYPPEERRYPEQFPEKVRAIATAERNRLWQVRRSQGLEADPAGPRWIPDAWLFRTAIN